ncbi:MAG: cupin domain-containing protein [Burkholderiaceae bacterium]
MSETLEQLQSYLPARIAGASDTPWVPSDTPGKSARLLRFLPNDEGFVELLRMEPGVAMPLHRHSGEIHAYNVSGSRQLCTGEVIGPGDYVYEPAGNVDWWRVVGDEPLVALVVVRGTVEFLAADGSVRSTANALTQRKELERYCQAHELDMPDLIA